MNPWRSGILAALFVGAALSSTERDALGTEDALAGAATAFRGNTGPLAAGLALRVADLNAHPQLALAQEALSIWAPLADQVGLASHQAALEDASFRTLNPAMHQHLTLAAGNATDALVEIRAATSVQAASLGVPVRMQSRVKSLYSTWKKMERKGVDVDGVHDRVALRLITANEADARALLASLHDRYEPVEGEFDDYILNPKANGYQSLHTAVRTPYGVAEFQLRTETMHAAAEAGDQAHWLYKRAS